MSVHPPGIGDWYRLRDGELFEVVAVDDGDGTVEVQYFDGTVEEFDLEDWHSQYGAGEIEDADAPEDWSGSVDMDEEKESAGYSGLDSDRRLNALGNDDLDLFD